MYFLAIVTDENIKAGLILPGYILCKSQGTSPNRSGWRVSNMTIKDTVSYPKLLVDSVNGREEMIEFLSAYRTRDHVHNDPKYTHEETKKYYPKGALFWFECDKYGDIEGPALFVKRVPEKNKSLDHGFKMLKEAWQHTKDIKELLLGEEEAIDLKESHVIIKLPQKTSSYHYNYKHDKKYKPKRKRKD